MTTNNDNFNGAEVNFVDRQKVDMYVMSNQKYFTSEKIMFLKEKLYTLDDTRFSMISCVEMKDPTTILLVSLFFWSYSIRDSFLTAAYHLHIF